MKYVFFVLFIVSTNIAMAQLAGFPFIDSTSEWHGESAFLWPNFFECNQSLAVTESSRKYFIQGDTILGGKKYYKLFLENTDFNYCLTNPTIQWTDSTTYLAHFLREENHRLYLYDTWTEAEALFKSYDDLSIGDTLQYNCIISSIDTLYLLYQPYLKYNCDCNSDFLIQGIGTKRSLFASLDCGIGIEGDVKNTCYIKNGFVVNVDPLTNCISTGDTTIYVSIKDIGKPIKGEVSPNPTSDAVFIDLPGRLSGNYSINSMEGRSILTKRFYDSDRLIIDFSSLNIGLYFVLLQFEHGEMSWYKILRI